MASLARSDRPALQRPGFSRLALYGVAAAAVVGFTIHWLWSRRRATESAHALYSATIEAETCLLDGPPPSTVTLALRAIHDRLELTSPSARPLEACGPELDDLARKLDEHRSVHYVRSPAMVATLARLVGELGSFDRGLDAQALLAAGEREAPADRIATLAAEATVLACSIAQAERAFPRGGCPVPAAPRSRLVPPEPRPALDAPLDGEIVRAAWDLTGRGGEAHLTVTARTGDRERSWHATSDGRLERWRAAELSSRPPPPGAATGPPIPLFDGTRLAAVYDPVGEVLWGAAGGKLRRLGPIPEPAEPRRAVGLGAPAVLFSRAGEKKGARFVAAYRAVSAEQRDVVVYFRPGEDSRPREREVPTGSVVALWRDDGAKIASLETRDDGTVHVLQRDVPPPGKPWHRALDAAVAGAAALSVPAGRARSCGLAGEKVFSWIGRAEKKAVLVAHGRGSVRPFDLAAGPRARTGLFCGGCPIGVLTASARALRLHLPAGPRLAASDVETPIAFDRKSPETASAACTARAYVVAYLAGERVVAQKTDDTGRRFLAPTVLATRTILGVPTEIHLAAVGDRLVAAWRRVIHGGRSLRLEVAVSDDDGATWK